MWGWRKTKGLLKWSVCFCKCTCSASTVSRFLQLSKWCDTDLARIIAFSCDCPCSLVLAVGTVYFLPDFAWVEFRAKVLSYMIHLYIR